MDKLNRAAALGQRLAHLLAPMVHAAVVMGLSEVEALTAGEIETRMAELALRIEARCYEFRAEQGAFPTNAPQYLLLLEQVSGIPSRRDSDTWQRIFEDFSKTRLTLKRFCQRRGLSYQAARAARSRLNRDKNTDCHTLPDTE